MNSRNALKIKSVRHFQKRSVFGSVYYFSDYPSLFDHLNTNIVIQNNDCSSLNTKLNVRVCLRDFT